MDAQVDATTARHGSAASSPARPLSGAGSAASGQLHCAGLCVGEKPCYNESMSEPIDDYLHSYSPELQAIIHTLREIAKKSMPEAHEMLYHGALGYSLTKSPFDRICYIAPQNKYVNFGFFFGTHLADPHQLLVGEGKRMRHCQSPKPRRCQSSRLGTTGERSLERCCTFHCQSA